MANFLDILRSSLLQNDDGGGEDITVTGRGVRPMVQQDGPQTNVSNRSYNQELADVQANQPQRRGAFGAKGTLRDILGTLGDAFLVQSGNKPVYGPRRDREQNADAMAGFTDNPLAAIERLGHNDPAAAEELYKTYQTDQLKNAQLQSLNASREDLAQSRQDKRNDTFYRRASNMLAGVETPEDVAAVSQLIRDTANKYSQSGSPIDISWLPDNLTPAQAKNLANSGIDRYKQESIDTAKENAVSRRISAQKQPAPRNAPLPTNASQAAPLISKMGKVGWGGLGKNEQDQLKSLGYSPDRGRGKKFTPPPLPPGFTIK